MPNPLLSSYRTGENRVTSSTMAVFERLDLALVTRLLGDASGAGAELRGVTFENQVSEGGDVDARSVPDARISGRFTWWFETKTARGGYDSEGHDRRQVRRHSSRLIGDPESVLFVLTPDAEKPAWFGSLDGVDESVRDRIWWMSFRDLAEAANVLLADARQLSSEQTRFLLAELVALYESDGLLSVDDTVIVAANTAWPEYVKTAAYVCQPNRPFRTGLTYFGFYADGAIQPVIARIRSSPYRSVLFSRMEAEIRRAKGQTDLAMLIERLLKEGSRVEGESYDVWLLSPRQDPETVQLAQPIVNDTRTATGRRWAWTLGQRYTQLAKLTSGPARTSQL